MVNHLKPDRVVRVTTLYWRVSRFWWKFLRNVFFQVRLTQLLKRSSTISIFLKSDKFLLRNDLFSPANQAAIKIFGWARFWSFYLDQDIKKNLSFLILPCLAKTVFFLTANFFYRFQLKNRFSFFSTFWKLSMNRKWTTLKVAGL